jgi:hypothetical protein
LQPFDGESGLKAASFRQGRFRFVRLALERIDGSQIDIGGEVAKAAVDRRPVGVDRGVEMPEAEFRIAQDQWPEKHERIMRAQPHCFRHIGFRLFETTK